MNGTIHHMMKKAMLSLALMFGLLFACATAVIWYLDLPLHFGIGAAVVVVLLQYAFGPLIISILFNIKFLRPSEVLGGDVLVFLDALCRDKRLPVPKIGVIDDGNPNAFVFGHFQWDARLVVTRGLLEILDEDEQKAVIAHELGHIKNNDFILMTLVSVIPLMMYQIYAWTKNRKDNIVGWIGLGAYGVYILSEFTVLAFSRIREYYADSFAKQAMGSGEHLKSALIKIAYGFTKTEKGKKLRVSTIGIINAAQSEAFTVLNYRSGEKDEAVDKALMGWDLRNIWGKLYELCSTHPLTAKRILALTDEKAEGSHTGLKDMIRFSGELLIKFIPWVIIAAIALPGIKGPNLGKALVGTAKTAWDHPILLVLLGAGILVRYFYSYGSKFEDYDIRQLLLREDASPVKGIPAVIKGKVIGKGVPGLFFSEDLVVEDGTGIMLIDYRQPFRFLEFLFGLIKVDNLIGREATMIGWYKRDIRPYFACRHILVDGKKYISYNYVLNKLAGFVIAGAGIALILAGLFIR